MQRLLKVYTIVTAFQSASFGLQRTSGWPAVTETALLTKVAAHADTVVQQSHWTRTTAGKHGIREQERPISNAPTLFPTMWLRSATISCIPLAAPFRFSPSVDPSEGLRLVLQAIEFY